MRPPVTTALPEVIEHMIIFVLAGFAGLSTGRTYGRYQQVVQSFKYVAPFRLSKTKSVTISENSL